MTNYSINYKWYTEIANEVKHGIPFAYTEHNEMYVEVEVEEENFIKVSKEKGWM